MRISSQMIQQGALRSLRRGTAALSKAQQEAVTGQRVRTVSDDPVDAGQIMRLDAQLRDISRYQRNGTWAMTRMSVEDAVITNLRELLQKAQKLGTAAASLPAGDPVRQATITDLQNLKTEILSLANTRVGAEYLFAGGNSTAPAFLPDGTYAGDSTARSTEINAGVALQTADTGDRLFGDSLAAIDVLLAQMQTGDAAGIQAAAGAVSSASIQVLTIQTTLGARMSEIQDVATALARTSVRVADQRDQLRSVDSAEAAVKLSTAQTALQQAYAVVSKVLSINLIDYLK
jgi:flagellar hook-associated protein 3 FlgL